MKRVLLALLCAVVLGSVAHTSADARPAFRKQFWAKYVKDNPNAEFVNAAKKANCLVCHEDKKDEKGKPDRKARNTYGQQLAKRLTKEDQKNVEKIQQMLDEVSKLPSNGDDSPTFGQLIEQGKLPGSPTSASQ